MIRTALLCHNSHDPGRVGGPSNSHSLAATVGHGDLLCLKSKVKFRV